MNGTVETSDKLETAEVVTTFLLKVDSIGRSIDEIEGNIQNVKANQLRILSAPGGDQKASADLDKLMREIKTSSVRTRADLKSLEEEVKSETLLPNTGVDRMKAHQCSALLKRFINVMNAYNECQLEYRDKCKGRIKLQLQIAGTSVSDDKVEEMLDSTNPSVFTEALMEQTEAAKRSLVEIEARHADILKLERCIEEMRDLFSEIALLVDQQGDLIDNIEHNVVIAEESVGSARKHVESAVKSKKRNIKMKIICITIAVILAIILVSSLAGIFGLR